MKILLVADIESKELWENYGPDTAERLRDVDLILAAGDLAARYLEFLVTMLNVPLLYVHGNHDSSYDEHPPEGCENIEDRIYEYRGMRVAGLGGSMKYREARHMYTEGEMEGRCRRLRRSVRKAARRSRFRGLLRRAAGAAGSDAGREPGFDILLTHAPCLGHGDMSDLPHRGFACFNDLLEEYRPLCLCHGHVHREYGGFARTREHPSGTLLINGSGWYIFDTDGLKV